ncbi:cytochrome c maturation protein CcmE [Chloroflexota bacterium]
MLKKKKFIIGGFILIAALVFLGYIGIMGSVTYYYEVNELLEKADALRNQTIRVSGNVADDVDREGLDMSFTILDLSNDDVSLPVFYNGAVPDTFKVGNQIVVEGKYSASIFEADNIIVKCGSKYEPIE